MELQNEIRMAAAKLFDEKGLKFTMDDVAKLTHISKKTIYKLYASKEDLLMDMVQTGFALIQSTKQKILDSDLPMKEKLKKVLIAMPEDYQSIDFRQLSGIEEKYPLVWKEITDHLGREWEPIYGLINQGIQEGKIRPIQLTVFKQMVTSSIDSFLYTDELKNNGIAYQDALDEMVNILMKGVWNDQAE